jgi:hypothetical protein
LCYDAQLDSSNIGSLNKYKTYTLEIRGLSDKDNQGELPQNYGYEHGRERSRGHSRPHGSSHRSTTFF